MFLCLFYVGIYEDIEMIERGKEVGYCYSGREVSVKLLLILECFYL